MIVWLASYPRSGNTLLRTHLKQRFGLDSYSVYNDELDIGKLNEFSDVIGHRMIDINTIDQFLARARSSDSLVFIKTHQLPGSWLRAKDSVIYIYRNGIQACYSYHDYLNRFTGARATLSQVMSGQVPYGLWGRHIHEWTFNTNSCEQISFEQLIDNPESLDSLLLKNFGLKPIGDSIPSTKALSRKAPGMVNQNRIDINAADADRRIDRDIFALYNEPMMRKMGYQEGMFSDSAYSFFLSQGLGKNSQLRDIRKVTNHRLFAPKERSKLDDFLGSAYQSSPMWLKQLTREIAQRYVRIRGLG